MQDEELSVLLSVDFENVQVFYEEMNLDCYGTKVQVYVKRNGLRYAATCCVGKLTVQQLYEIIKPGLEKVIFENKEFKNMPPNVLRY